VKNWPTCEYSHHTQLLSLSGGLKLRNLLLATTRARTRARAGLIALDSTFASVATTPVAATHVSKTTTAIRMYCSDDVTGGVCVADATFSSACGVVFGWAGVHLLAAKTFGDGCDAASGGSSVASSCGPSSCGPSRLPSLGTSWPVYWWACPSVCLRLQIRPFKSIFMCGWRCVANARGRRNWEQPSATRPLFRPLF